MTILLMLLLIWLGWQILKISFRIIFWLVIIALIAAVLKLSVIGMGVIIAVLGGSYLFGKV